MFPVLSANGPSGYNLNNSLRFRSSANGFLNRTPTATGSQQKFTLSTWVKLGSFATGVDKFIWASADNAAAGVNPSLLWKTFSGTYTFIFDLGTGGGLTTTQVFRDPSAWYHIVINADTTQATAADRMKMYINGNQVTAFSSATYPTQNTNILINTPSYPARIGGVLLTSSTDRFFDGYMTEVNFIDGQALTPSSFGSTNATTGVWQPAKYTGTYGTNGFYLNFSDIATTSGSNAGLGKDFSGNGNYWNTNNISVTAGSTYDAMTDSPTLTSATVANYAVMNPLQTSSLATVTDANLTVKGNSASNSAASVATMQVPTGLYYAEFTITGSNAEYPVIGVVNTDTLLSNSNLLLYGSPGYYSGVGYQADGQKRITSLSAYGSTFTTGDVIGIAVDTTNGAVYFSKNNTWQNSGVPTSGASKTGAAYTYTAGSINLIMSVAPYNTSSGVNANFGQRPFSYTPPTGFVRLNTYNLPDSTIKKGNTAFNAVTWTGNNSTGGRSITGVGFSPDIVWVKNRGAVVSNVIYDTIRGAGNNKELVTDSTLAEGGNNNDVYDYLSSFDSDGFTSTWSGSNTTLYFNYLNLGFVGWCWDAGSSTVTNTDGSISSQVRANTTAGVSVVTYTGNGVSSATVGHGLGVAPKWVIHKCRSATGAWKVNHVGIPNQWIDLNLTDAASSGGGTNGSLGYQSTNTSTTFQFTAGSSTVNNVNANGSTYVAYCWAEIAGFSKFGSYTGNGSTDGPFVYTGFRPKYIVLKSTTTAGSNWWAEDTSRSTYNAANALLFPNLSNAEYTTAGVETDILSNGFKLRTSNNDGNKSGDTFIYMAFAENPFKNSLAR